MKSSKWSLFRLIINIANFILNLIRLYYEKKPVLFIINVIVIVSIPVSAVFIPKDHTEVPPTPPPRGGVTPPIPGGDVTPPIPVEPDTDKGSGDGTQHPENRSFSKELKERQEEAEDGTQHLEKMHQKVKEIDQDAQSMKEKAKEMDEKVQNTNRKLLKQWLKNNGYPVTLNSIPHEGVTSTLVSDTTSIHNVTLENLGNNKVRLTVENVGEAIFTIDANGELQPTQ